MRLRSTARHLVCPACDRPLTPVNRLNDRLSPGVARVLRARHDGWSHESGACDDCIDGAEEALAPTGVLQALRVRLRSGRSRFEVRRRRHRFLPA